MNVSEMTGMLQEVGTRIRALREIAGYWPGLWDFVPYDCYKEVLSQLDPVESAPLIKNAMN